MKNRVLCLGNEFIEEDSFAKKVGERLSKELEESEFIDIKDSFELLNYLQEDNESIFILDVVENLDEVRLLEIEDLKESKIMSAHDFDASFFLKLIGKNKKIKIIGIPMKGDVEKVKEIVKSLLLEPNNL